MPQLKTPLIFVFYSIFINKRLTKFGKLRKKNILCDLKKRKKKVARYHKKKIYPFFLSFFKFRGENNLKIGQIFQKYENMPNYAQNSKAYFPFKNYALGFQNMPNLSFWA